MIFLKTIFLNIIQLYAYLLILRSLLYYSGMDKTQPAAKFAVYVSQPLLRPIQPFFPCLKGFETVSLFVSFILVWFLQIVHLFFISGHLFTFMLIPTSIISAFFYWISSIFSVYCMVIVVWIILSFFAPYSPALKHIEKILAPLRKPFYMLKLGRFDFSILPFFLMAQWASTWGLPQLNQIMISLII